MLTFYFDLACPYAHLAAARMDALAERCGVAVDWRPVRLATLLERHETQAAPAGAWNAAKVDHGRKDVLRQADAWGIPLAAAEAPNGSELALRVLAGASPGKRGLLARAYFHALWVEGADLDDQTTVARLAAAHGVVPEPGGAAVDALTAEAAERGVFGVPTVAVGDELFFGSDREAFVEEALTGRRSVLDRPSAAPSEPTTVKFFHDFASPFSYLGAMRIASVVGASGCAVAWRPILLGALFRGLGTPNVPLFAFPPAKQQTSQRDLFAWADWHGLPLQWPTVFPVRTVLPLRVALQAPTLTLPLYRALWEEDQDIGKTQVVEEVARKAGLDPAPLLDGAQSPQIKAALFSNTEEARRSGVCGVPTVAFEDGLCVWGQDRFGLVSRLLSGWRPRPGAC